MSVDMMLKEIGERVRIARQKKNISQAQFAALLDVSVPYISNIEHGKQAMSVVTFARICDQLDVSADWLIYNRSPEFKRIADEEATRILEDCTPAERRAMLKVITCVKEALRSVKAADEKV